MLGALADSCDENASGQWVQGTAMTDLDLDGPFVTSSSLLIRVFLVSSILLGLDPWRKELGAAKVRLKIS